MTLNLDEQYAKAVEDAEVYAGTWWARSTNVMAHDRLARVPGLAAALRARARDGYEIQSAEVFHDVDGWDSDRAVLHQDVLDDLVRTATGSGLPPHVYFTLGLPGSGKTRTLREVARRHAVNSARSPASDAAGGGVDPALDPALDPEVMQVSDADDVRAALPEYDGGRGSQILQDEVVVVTYNDRDQVPGGGLQDRIEHLDPGTAVLVVDLVGDPAFLPAAVESMADRGWTVFVLLAECPVEVCVDRVRRRAIDSGRIVSIDYVRGVGDRPERALHAAVATGRVSGWAHLDTSVEATKCTVTATGDTESFGPIGAAPLA